MDKVQIHQKRSRRLQIEGREVLFFISPFINGVADACELSAVTFVIKLSAPVMKVTSFSLEIAPGRISSDLLSLAWFLAKIDEVTCNLLAHTVDEWNVDMIRCVICVNGKDAIMTQVKAGMVNVIDNSSGSFTFTAHRLCVERVHEDRNCKMIEPVSMKASIWHSAHLAIDVFIQLFVCLVENKAFTSKYLTNMLEEFKQAVAFSF